MSGNWETKFSFGADDGLPRRPLASVAPVATVTVPPPSNFFTSNLERIHRVTFPTTPISIPMPVVDFDEGYRDPFAIPSPDAEPSVAETDPQPPVLSPPQRDLAAEVRELIDPVTDYLGAFVVVEPPDTSELAELAYVNPLATTELKQSATPSAEAREFKSRKATVLRLRMRYMQSTRYKSLLNGLSGDRLSARPS